MASFMNTLGAVSRRGQWRFRQVMRARGADGRLDLTDAGLIDFSTCSEVLLAVTPRATRSGSWASWVCENEAPALSASMTAGTLLVVNPGIVEAVFPAGSLLAIPPGLYDVRLSVTIGPEMAEIFNEPIEFT